MLITFHHYKLPTFTPSKEWRISGVPKAKAFGRVISKFSNLPAHKGVYGRSLYRIELLVIRSILQRKVTFAFCLRLDTEITTVVRPSVRLPTATIGRLR